MPKATSTPCSASERTTACPPVIRSAMFVVAPPGSWPPATAVPRTDAHSPSALVARHARQMIAERSRAAAVGRAIGYQLSAIGNSVILVLADLPSCRLAVYVRYPQRS